jgi:transposase
MLYFPTLCATVHNDRIHAFYQRLTSNAKSKKAAILAAMRKLMLIAFTIYKSGKPYQPLLAKTLPVKAGKKTKKDTL